MGEVDGQLDLVLVISYWVRAWVLAGSRLSWVAILGIGGFAGAFICRLGLSLWF